MLVVEKERECAISEDELLSAFRVFDKNDDGYITAAELTKVLTSLGEEMPEKQVQDLIREADTNGDGMIDYAGNCYQTLHI